MSSVIKAFARTLIDRENYEFTWAMENLHFLPSEEGANLTSPIFVTKCGLQLHFQLISEVPDASSGALIKNLYLHCKNISSQLTLQHDTSITFDESNHRTCGRETFEANKEGAVRLSVQKNPFTYAQTASVECKLQLSRGNVTSFLDSKITSNGFEVTMPKLKFDWAFLDENLSDVKLQAACGKEIPAHRLVLAAASPVFKAMFNRDMLEKKSQSVNMADVSYETAVEMLRYIYTGAIENNEITSIIDVLTAANKYQLEDLKDKCEDTLSRNITIKNAIDILKVADKCCMKTLKKNAIDFMKLHVNRALESDDVVDMILSMEKLFKK